MRKRAISLFLTLSLCLALIGSPFSPIAAAGDDYPVLKAGDYIQFGKWDHATAGSQEGEETDILWWVVEVDEDSGTARLVSKYVLDKLAMDPSADTPVSSINSPLSDWLNNAFLDNAFTTKELAILTDYNGSAYTMAPGSLDDTTYMVRTPDPGTMVFIPCYYMDGYFKPTTQPLGMGEGSSAPLLATYKNGVAAPYWTATGRTHPAAYGIIQVTTTGTNLLMANAVSGVRPMIEIDMTDLDLYGEGSMIYPYLLEDPDAIAGTELKSGDYIQFGSHINATADGYENDETDILWWVVEVDEESGTARLVSKYILDHKAMDPGAAGGPSSSINSPLSDWLNGEFLNNTFTVREQALLLDYDGTAYTLAPGSLDDGTYAEHRPDAGTKVFLPCYYMDGYFKPTSQPLGLSEGGPEPMLATYSNGVPAAYWTGTSRNYPNYAPPIYNTIITESSLDFVPANVISGVRPMIKIDLNKLKMYSAGTQQYPYVLRNPGSGSGYGPIDMDDPLGILASFEAPAYLNGMDVTRNTKFVDVLNNLHPTVRDSAYWQAQKGVDALSGEQSLEFLNQGGVVRSLAAYNNGVLGNRFTFSMMTRVHDITPGSNLSIGLWANRRQGTPLLIRFFDDGAIGWFSPAGTGIFNPTGATFSEGDILEITFVVDLENTSYRITIDNKTTGVAPVICSAQMYSGYTQADFTDAGSGIFISCSLWAELDDFTLIPNQNETPNVKTASYLYPSNQVESAVTNAAQYDWAADIRDGIVTDAAYWRGLSYDELWDKMFQPNTGPRSLMVWSDGYCPTCGETIGMYDWYTNPANAPWKVFCPKCHDCFPKNDFKAFYDSGIDPRTGLFGYAAADQTLLYNEEHPDPTDPLHKYGIDDGRGYFNGTNRWYFIGYYQYRGAWYNDILPGIQKLSAAYMVTGDINYARRAAILIDHVADYFPDFEYYSQGLVYERPSSTGYITYNIDSAFDVRYMAEAYDQIFDAIKNDEILVDFLSAKASLYTQNPVYSQNSKTSFAGIQSNIETRILRHALANRDRIATNYPNTDLTVIIIQTVLGWEWNRDMILSSIASVTSSSTAVDGTTGEKGLANYTANTIQYFASFLAKYAALENDFLSDLIRQCPNLAKTWRFFIDTKCLDSFYPHTGDSGWFAQKEGAFRGMYIWRPDRESISPIPSLYTFLWKLYQATGDIMYAKLMYTDNGGSVEGLPYDIFSSEGEAIRQGIVDIVTEYGEELGVGSVNKTQYHIAIMRRPDDTSPVFWLDYDTGGGHGHLDGMNLGLYGYGLDLMTDFGYPPTNKDGWNGPWTQWYISNQAHNTVTVDGYFQRYDVAGQTDLWADGDAFRAVRAQGENMYSPPALATTSRYERTIAMSDINDNDSYLIDIFRVAGGSRHDRFMHTQYAELETSDLDLSPVSSPWSYQINISNVQEAANPEPGWSVDFAIEDYYNYLEPGADIHVKYTDFTTGADMYTMEAWTEIGYYNPVERYIPRIATTRTGENGLTSTFVGVIEPYDTTSKIAAIKRLPLTDSYGNILPDSYVALEVILTTGFTDIIIAADPLLYKDGDVMIAEGWENVEVMAELAMLRVSAKGELKRVAVSSGIGMVVNGDAFLIGYGEDYFEISFDIAEPELTGAVAEAEVTKLNGSRNELTITVTEFYSDGSERVIAFIVMIDNNAAAAYQVGPYKVYVDTKGNTQIRACYIIE